MVILFFQSFNVLILFSLFKKVIFTVTDTVGNLLVAKGIIVFKQVS